MADNYLHNAFTEFHATGTEGIVDKCSSLGDVMNNLGIRLKDETLKQIDTIKDTSGNLRQSVKFNTKIFGESFATELYLADYYDFINQGVRGAESTEKAPDSDYSYKDPANNKTMPPYSALKKWSEQRGLNVFAVRRSIWSKGIKKKGYFDKVVEDVKNGEIHSLLIQDLKSAGKLGILNEIKKIIK